MPVPPFETDDRWFVILAQSPTAVLVQHRISGSFAIFKLDWKCSGQGASFQANEVGAAWAAYMKEATP